jgi:hypothetical protein
VSDAFKTPAAVGEGGFRAPSIRDRVTGQQVGLSRGNPITKQYDFNVGVGGPIVKGKVWFYASYRDNNQYKIILGLPDKAQSRLTNYTGKLTYQINPRNQLIGFFNQRTKLQPLRELSLAIPPEAAYYQPSRNRPMKLEWTSVLSDRLFLDLQVAHWYNRFPLFPPQTKSSDTTGVPVGRIDLVTGQRSGANGADGPNNTYQDQIRWKPQVSGSISYFKDNWGGSHSFKVGFEAYRDRRSYLSFQPGDIYYRDRNGAPSEVDIWNTPNTAINDCKLMAGFAQDGWALSKRITLNLGARFDHYVVGWPEQSYTPNQAAFFQPVTTPATVVARFNELSPRIGFAWDLSGKGKTVWKSFFGRYYYNPSPDTLTGENPVGAATKRYEFKDLNGNRIVDGPQELGQLLSTQGGAGFVKIDRNIRDPYGQELSTHLEHELLPDVSVRGSYVFKALRNGWAEVDLNRVGAYTIPFSFVDVGPDNTLGTGDDQTLQLFDRQPGVAENRVFTNPGRVGLPSFDGNYHTVEFAVNRRFKNKWLLLTSFEHTWADDFRGTASSTSNLGVAQQSTAYLWQPNRRRFGRQKTTFWNYKLIGRYEFPWRIGFAASYKLQSGFNWARTISVPFRNAGSETILAEPVSAHRAPNVHIVDFRVEKSIKLSDRLGKLSAIVDVFNALNANTVTNFRVTGGTGTGANRFMEVISLLDPRIVRFGVRYDF